MPARAIDSKLTAMGKDERAINVIRVVHKNYDFEAGQHDVWASRQIALVDSVAKATSVQCATNLKLRLGVRTLNRTHHSGADFSCHHVDQRCRPLINR